MRQFVIFLVIVFSSIEVLYAREYKWNVSFEYFFNNNEYAASTFAADNTQIGTWLNTLGGISWDNSHSIFGGINFLKIPGTQHTIDKIDLSIFYEFETSSVFFRAGAFPRQEVLSNYNTFFFRDSINLFMPQMQGVFFRLGNRNNFVNAWLDWTGMPSAEQRESFLFGFSGRASHRIFFADFQSYVNHLSNRAFDYDLGVSEQMQMLASVGIEHQTAKGFHTLVSAGILASSERLRRQQLVYRPLGFVARADAEFWGIGTQNLLYLGNPRMKFYEREGSALYWQTPFLQGSTYLHSRWYIRLLETPFAQVRFDYNLHFTEGKMLHQQMFTVSANIGNWSKEKNTRTSFPWSKFF